MTARAAAGLLLWAQAVAWQGGYLGGPGVDDCDDVAVLPDGDLVLACHSTSPRFGNAPAKLIQRRDDMDAFVVRVDAEMVNFRWSARLGGSAHDGAWRLRVAGDTVWVAGITKSADFPVTADAAQGRFGGGESDGFVAAVELGEGRVKYASYFGGAGADEVSDLVVRGSEVTAAGTTASKLPGAKKHGGGGKKDGFVARVWPAGGWTLVLGGEEDEKLTALELESGGTLVAAGYSESVDFPGGRMVTKFKGVADGLVVRLSATGEFAGGTFVGGEEQDTGWGLALGADGSVHVTGITASKRLPVKGKVYQRTLHGAADVFVAKLDRGFKLEWLTYFGGAGKDVAGTDGRSVAVRANGDVVFVGSTDSADLPVENAVQANAGGGEADGFLAVLSGDGARLRFGTYWGGGGRDALEGVALGAGDRIVATGLGGWPPRGARTRAHAGGFFDATLLSVEVPQGFLRR